jgi:hypothetical protein
MINKIYNTDKQYDTCLSFNLSAICLIKYAGKNMISKSNKEKKSTHQYIIILEGKT